MKRFFNTIAVLSSALLIAAACQPEIISPVQGNLPSASDFDVEITVDQATNYVTFTMKNKGMVPMWIFGDEKIDGKANKLYSYTANGLTLRFRDEGEHQVEVKAYNASGVSQGSKICTFTLENTYRDPFDASPYVNAISNKDAQIWVWNSGVDGHFGCGESVSNPKNWWSCPVDGKDGMSMYDDEMTFSADGTYTFDPVDGNTYVNWNSGYHSELWSGTENDDYIAPIEKYSAKYWFENNWNDAGIEEIYLCLDENSNLSYIGNPDMLKNPRYLVLSTIGELRKEVKLAHWNGGIAWYYDFITKGANDNKPVVLNMASGKADAKVKQGATIEGEGINFSKVWIDPDFFEYVDPAHLTFKALDGNYRFENKNGMILVRPLSGDGFATWDNSQALWIIGDGGGKPEGALIGWNTGDAPLPCAQIDANKYQITLWMKAEGGSVKVFGQNDWGTEWKKDKYGEVIDNGLFNIPNEDGNIHTMAENEKNAGFYKFTFVNKGGVLDMSVEAVTVTQPTPEDLPTDGGGTDWVAGDSADNLINGGELGLNNFWWANDSWQQIADPEIEFTGNTAKITINEPSGGSQWQGQVHLHTGVVLEEGKAYDFKIVINPSVDLNGATVKPHPAGDDGHFFSEGRHDLTAYEDNVITCENHVAQVAYNDLVITLDFPGCPAGAVIEVKGIIVQEHREKPASGGWVAEDSAENLINGGALVLNNFWWANDSWQQTTDPEIEFTGNTAKITVTEPSGGSQWQGQAHFGTGVVLEEGKAYDFRIVINPTVDLNGATVKPHPAGDDGHFFSEGRHDITAYEDNVITCENHVAQVGYNDLVVTLDFPGCPAGAIIEVKGIIIQEHK